MKTTKSTLLPLLFLYIPLLCITASHSKTHPTIEQSKTIARGATREQMSRKESPPLRLRNMERLTRWVHKNGKPELVHTEYNGPHIKVRAKVVELAPALIHFLSIVGDIDDVKLQLLEGETLTANPNSRFIILSYDIHNMRPAFDLGQIWEFELTTEDSLIDLRILDDRKNYIRIP